MPAPTNIFKRRLAAGETVIGCWLDLADGYAAEIMGTAGFDWLVIDGEHGPNDLRAIRDQLIALETSASHPVVRVPIGETWIVKQVLDIGAQTILVPMVETAVQAQAMVRACTYPPQGTRGVGAAMARASRFAAIADYVETADTEICLLIQAESRAALAALDEILGVDGIDGVFIGPADLAADMGHAGNSEAAEVQRAIAGALERIAAAGKAPGILATTDAGTRRYLDAGAQFVAVGADVLLLAGAARQLAAKWIA